MSEPREKTPNTGPFGPSLDAWSVALAAAGVIATLLAAFLIPPPFDLGATDMLPKFGKFVVAVVIAVVLAPFLRYSSRNYTLAWSVASLVMLLVSAAALYWYLWLGGHYVRDHERANGTVIRYVISGSYSPTGQMLYNKLVRQRTVPPNSEDMIKHASGSNFEERRYSIWDRDAVAEVQLKLGFLYVGLFVVFGALIILAGQTLRSARS